MLMTACASPSQPALNRLPVELGLVHHGCAGSTMRLATAIALVLATVLGAIPGRAQAPAALAISSGGYQNAPVLRNPTNDASYIAAFSVRRIILGAVEDMRDIGSLGSSLHRMPPGSGHDMTRSPRRSSWLTASLPLRARKIELSRGAKWSSLGSGLVKRPQALCHNETDRIVVADSQCITKGPKALPTAPWGEASR